MEVTIQNRVDHLESELEEMQDNVSGILQACDGIVDVCETINSIAIPDLYNHVSSLINAYNVLRLDFNALYNHVHRQYIPLNIGDIVLNDRDKTDQ